MSAYKVEGENKSQLLGFLDLCKTSCHGPRNHFPQLTIYNRDAVQFFRNVFRVQTESFNHTEDSTITLCDSIPSEVKEYLERRFDLSIYCEASK